MSISLSKAVNENDIYYSQFKKAKTKFVEPFLYTRNTHYYKVAVIAPYRDNPFQDRQRQLEIFVHFMTDYLTLLGAYYDFHLIIVEQAKDGRKFNRGKLLNVGFRIAKAHGYDYHIFHDIDLLPDNNLLGYYGFYPDNPLHLAAVWKKYRHLPLFFGGVCSFAAEQFETLNGYPNDFWGWGGEDEELYHRIVDHDMVISRPTIGAFKELEHVDSKTLPDFVNRERFQSIAEREGKSSNNGLSNLQIEQLYEPEKLHSHASKYTVML
uniref:N-terminal region of glycosyl transferase group 7 n=1 Tax=Candidatus Kentrum sp. LPFa TaxID=2126335 RepID=A0A450WQG4_9GAMM|nr:MAG: N-terminal region of glycosyl transferase group 7 [Candidatus Kentron sp. LPFa]